jgi:hypothetical protein
MSRKRNQTSKCPSKLFLTRWKWTDTLMTRDFQRASKGQRIAIPSYWNKMTKTESLSLWLKISIDWAKEERIYFDWYLIFFLSYLCLCNWINWMKNKWKSLRKRKYQWKINFSYLCFVKDKPSKDVNF